MIPAKISFFFEIKEEKDFLLEWWLETRLGNLRRKPDSGFEKAAEAHSNPDSGFYSGFRVED